MPFDPGRIGDDLDAYFAAREAQYKDIKPGTEKRVIWAGGARCPHGLGRCLRSRLLGHIRGNPPCSRPGRGSPRGKSDLHTAYRSRTRT